jgi:3',5'-cyclic AMP phosphodiesterase CpdA
VLVGAGDIAECGVGGAEQTARLLDRLDGAIFTAGDNAYFQGSAQQYRDCYHPTWGRHRSRTYPAPGNHEYEQPGAGPYYEYFGEVSAPSAPGYYDFTLGSWRIYSLNSNIDTDASSLQWLWLRREIQADTARCAMAIMHHPRFNSGQHGNELRLDAIWRLLYEGGVDVVVAGHEHAYERFAPQDGMGRADPASGIRQFIVGTGGATLYRSGRAVPNSEVRGYGTWGVIRFVLRASEYSWEFVPVDAGGFRDSGTALCH